jgi:hypothetical protein
MAQIDQKVTVEVKSDELKDLLEIVLKAQAFDKLTIYVRQNLSTDKCKQPYAIDHELMIYGADHASEILYYLKKYNENGQTEKSDD